MCASITMKWVLKKGNNGNRRSGINQLSPVILLSVNVHQEGGIRRRVVSWVSLMSKRKVMFEYSLIEELRVLGRV